jgi:hypothetical protein
MCPEAIILSDSETSNEVQIEADTNYRINLKKIRFDRIKLLVQ